jgi:hypothetical protein
MPPPALVNLDGKGLRPATSAERESARREIVRRAEDYARWRFHAFELGECAHPY